MNVARKITLALGVVALLAFAIEAVFQFRMESRQSLAGMQRDHRLLGRTLGGTIARAWTVDGEQAALALLQQSSRFQDEVRLRWVWIDDAAQDPADVVVSRSALRALTAGDALSVERDDASGRPQLVTYIPASVDGRLGAIEVKELLEHRRRHMLLVARLLVITTATMALFFFLVATWFGRRLIGEPVGQLVDMARALGRGDLHTRVHLPHKDELGELALAMNQMGEDLLATREKLAAETAAKVSALENLRHADRLTTVGKLAAGIAHELGTPMNVIDGRAKMIASGEATGVEALACARIISEQTTVMTRIIRQLLEFARRRAPQRSLQRLGPLVQKTADLLASLAAKRSARIVVDVPEGLEANVDAGGLGQVLTNIIMNAVQAARPNGTIRVSADTVQRAAPGRDGVESWIRLGIDDDGPGIPPEVLPHIFEPFFTTKDVGEGTGLGLSVSYGIVQDHGGWMDVASQPGQGTRFSVYLPASS